MIRPLVIGDRFLDVYLRGRVNRLNPEGSHIPLVDVEESITLPGGCANVAETLCSLGLNPQLLANVNPQRKFRILVDGQIIFRYDSRNEGEGNCCNYEELVLAAEECDFILVSDYQKGFIRSNTIDAIEKLGKPVYVSTKGDPTPWAGFATAMVCNNSEYSKYYSQYKAVPLCVETLGKEGCEVREKGLITFRAAAPATSPACVVGAGDTAFAVFSLTHYCLSKRFPGVLAPICGVELAAKMSMHLAADVVSKPLTASPSWGAVRTESLAIIANQIIDEIRKP